MSFLDPTIIISIHAPVKGATGGQAHIVVIFCISIHAPVKGATSEKLDKIIQLLFQSTLP